MSGPWMVKLSMVLFEEEENSLLLPKRFEVVVFAVVVTVALDDDDDDNDDAVPVARTNVVGTRSDCWNADEDLGTLLRMDTKHGTIDTFIFCLGLGLASVCSKRSNKDAKNYKDF